MHLNTERTKDKLQLETPLISIIVPCYNSERTLLSCLNSINYDAFPLEVILVDDGSTDGTREICTALSNGNSRIRCFSKPNGGYSSAVNMGLDVAKGEYLLFLGSDDQLGPNLLLSLVDEINRFRPDVIAFRSIRSDGKRDCSESITYRLHLRELDFYTVEQLHQTESEILSIRNTAKCFRRAIGKDLRLGGKYGIAADDIYSMLMCLRAHSFSFLPVDGYLWTIDNSSLSLRKRSSGVNRDILQNWAGFYSRLAKDYPMPEHWPLSAAHHVEEYKERVLALIASNEKHIQNDLASFRLVLPLLTRCGLQITKRNFFAINHPYLYRAWFRFFSRSRSHGAFEKVH